MQRGAQFWRTRSFVSPTQRSSRTTKMRFSGAKNLARRLVAADDVLVDLKKEFDKELALTML
jgi:hypothetical protein